MTNETITLDRITFLETEVYYLEMREAPPTCDPPAATGGIRFEKLSPPIDVTLYKKYYYGVGSKFQWLDRMVMAEEVLKGKINAENVAIYIMIRDNQPAGFVELVRENDFVEILYFGLLPAYIGKGMGKIFLRWVVQKAWSYHPEWIQLNTCLLDHPLALPAYLSQGFKIVNTRKELRRILKQS